MFDDIHVSVLQCKVLLKKNWWLMIKNWRLTLIQLGSPVIFVVVLFLLQLLYKHVQNDVDKFPVATPLGDVPKCVSQNHARPCMTILYTPGRGQFKEIDAIIDILARRNALTISNDTLSYDYPEELEHDIYSIKNDTLMTQFIFKYPNLTQSGMPFLVSVSRLYQY